MSIFRPRLVWTLVLCAGLATPAFANPIPVGLGSQIDVKFTGVHPGQGSAGLYNWTTGGTTYSGLVYADPATNSFVSFCLEKTEYTSSSFQPYTLKPLEQGPSVGHMQPGTADALRAMWAEYRDDADDSPAAAAAFQNAVWHLLAHPEVVPVPVGSPIASSLSGTPSLFDQFINPFNWNSGFANLAVMSNSGLQDQLVQVTFNSTLETPEPGMLALGLLVLPAMLLRRRMMRAANG